MLSFPLLQSSRLVASTYLVSFLNWDLIQQQSQLNSNKITVITTIWNLFNNQFTHSVEYSSLNIWFLDLINTAFCCKWWSPHILKFFGSLKGQQSSRDSLQFTFISSACRRLGVQRTWKSLDLCTSALFYFCFSNNICSYGSWSHLFNRTKTGHWRYSLFALGNKYDLCLI